MSGFYLWLESVGSLLASQDSTARIWTIGDGPCNSTIQRRTPNVLVLKPLESRATEEHKDVTTLDWNVNFLLVIFVDLYFSGCLVREPCLQQVLTKAKSEYGTDMWNKIGDYLLSGSVDRTAVVWNVKSGKPKQQFEFPAVVLDVDWQNNDSFAVGSIDNMIYICKVGENRPVKRFSGHKNEVNAVKWDPSGSLLASCSDDTTVKIWNMEQDVFLHDFREHRKETYTIKWSPTGAGTSNPNQQLLLASGSFDCTVNLWDVEQGRLLHTLNGHSPNGQYLASGSVDTCMNIWSVKEAKIVKTYNGDGIIFEVCWNKEGNKVAACFSNNKVCVFDIRL
ncbi:hypothetical protein H5410_062670 [Solanum commersonii]|uniref:Uncharacterized protein n=1 Tax=Solanum commersonii TaxID=4109 RepID=A0A9J5WD12_SOLCO|nr:hypothetical protein H5410_062670 [Solanum commersonii]